MTEGRDYLSTWKKIGRKFELNVVNMSSIKATGETFHEAVENLYEKILHELGDGEPILEFDRKLPASVLPAAYGTPEILVIMHNGSAVLRSKVNDLFDGGMCSLCRRPGIRTDHQVSLSDTERLDGIAVSSLGPIFSRRFIDLFERVFDAVALRPVNIVDNSSAEYYEILPEKRSYVRTIGVRELPNLTGNRCSSCGTKMFCYNDSVMFYISKADIPVQPFFWVNTGFNLLLCGRGREWRKVVKKHRTKGVVSSQIGVVPPNEVIRDPDLPLLQRVRKLPP